MKDNKNKGKILLIAKYRKLFRIPENLNHYDSEDLLNAERKFIKMAVEKGGLSGGPETTDIRKTG